jgi:hypothetical protein
VRSGTTNLSRSDSITFTETSYRGGAFYLSGSDEVDTGEGSVRIGDASGSDELTFDEKFGRVKEFSANETVALDEATETPPRVEHDLIELTEAFTLDASLGGSDTLYPQGPPIPFHTFTLNMRETYALSVVKSLSGSDLIAIADGGFLVLNRIDPCAIPYIALSARNNFILTYPYDTPTTTLTLKIPLFGNTDKTETGFKIRYTLNNQLSVVRGNWPTIRRFKFDFSALTEAQRDDFLAFYLLSLGQEIGLLDHEDRQWRGVIISDGKTTQVGQGCDYSTGFEFQGVLV